MSESHKHADQLLSLLPHRPPMLLIDQVLSVSDTEANAILAINQNAAFFNPEHGVPAWIGIEYMGQTAALIGGHKLNAGTIEPHIGLLLGTRKYQSAVEWFAPGTCLQIHCRQAAMVQGTLATFQCTIRNGDQSPTAEPLATAAISVFRRPLETTAATVKEND